MRKQHTRCLGQYDFDQIARHAHKRYVDGISTVDLINSATTDKEREEIALVCTLDLEDKQVLNVELDCKHADKCKVTNCRSRLRQLIETQLAARDRNQQ